MSEWAVVAGLSAFFTYRVLICWVEFKYSVPREPEPQGAFAHAELAHGSEVRDDGGYVVNPEVQLGFQKEEF